MISFEKENITNLQMEPARLIFVFRCYSILIRRVVLQDCQNLIRHTALPTLRNRN